MLSLRPPAESAASNSFKVHGCRLLDNLYYFCSFGRAGPFGVAGPVDGWLAGVFELGRGCCNSVGVGVFVCGLPSGTGCGTVVVRGPCCGVLVVGRPK